MTGPTSIPGVASALRRATRPLQGAATIPVAAAGAATIPMIDPVVTPSAASGIPSHLAHLDGLRGMAALWVLVAHVGIWTGYAWLPNPKLAVDIFIVCSGFLMVHQ